MAASALPPSSPVEAFRPAPALADCVTDIWVWELAGAGRAASPARLTLLPDGHPTLQLVYGAPLVADHQTGSFTTRSAVCGFQRRPVQVSCDGLAAGITVRFKPWALAVFMPMPMHMLVDRRLALAEILPGAGVCDLEDELRELPTRLARVRRVESFLLRLRGANGVAAIVAHAAGRLSGTDAVVHTATLARELGASERTLERHFRDSIGVGPKLFSRVMRLQRALTLPQQPASWSEHALDAGYYDQAHLLRESRVLFGAAPSRVVQAQGIAREFQALARKTSLSASLFR